MKYCKTSVPLSLAELSLYACTCSALQLVAVEKAVVLAKVLANVA